MQALQNSGADVSTLTPLVDLLNEGLAQSTGTLAVIIHGAGQCWEGTHRVGENTEYRGLGMLPEGMASWAGGSRSVECMRAREGSLPET